MPYKVGVFIGSLAKESINRKLAKALQRLAPPSLQMEEIPIKDLPIYSWDYDADYPPVAKEFKAAIARVDALLFVTPEYNRSVPGGLKNAIDWGSRPWGQNSFDHIPAAVIGAWSAELEGRGTARVVLRPHPELAQSVRGTVERDGTTAQAAGDVDDGDLTLEESLNGKNISATWIGRVVDGSCGKEIRGTWTNAQDNRPLPFVLRKQAGTP